MVIERRMKETFTSLLVFFSLLGPLRAEFENNHKISSLDEIHVGVILDMGSLVGKVGNSCMSMAISDFYRLHNHYNTRIILHTRDSKGEPLLALSAALDLLENTEVQAIIGPQTSMETKLLAELGEKTEVPIISFSTTSPSPSPTQFPYLVKVAQEESSQVEGIVTLMRAFNWTGAVLIYEKTDDGSEIIPYLVDSFQEFNIRIVYMSSIRPSSNNDEIIEQELQMLKTLQTAVFVVHMSPSLASQFFLMVNKLGMMSKGYAWISTDKTMNLLHSMNSSVIESMQGVLGFKSYIPPSKELHNFTTRWRREFRDNMDGVDLNVFGIWAYDAVWALAKAAERVGVKISSTRNYQDSVRVNSMDFAVIGTSHSGPMLLEEILQTRFMGLSGKFGLNNSKLVSKELEIVNVINRGDKRVGFWSGEGGHGRTKEFLYPSYNGTYPISKIELEPIIWPGISMDTPKNWVVQKLKIGVPNNSRFEKLVNVTHDPHANETIVVTGFCMEVFKAAIELVSYEVPYDLIPVDSAAPYNEIIDRVYHQQYDAVVGDVTATANRSLYVDFSLPFTDPGVGMLVRNDEANMWIFLKPLTAGLWVTSACFFVVMGIVVWMIEHPINDEFRGPPSKQIGVIFWFAFSTLVFAHSEKLLSNLSRFVVIVWLFVVLILTSSYSATLTSMLTVQQIQSISKGNNIGYQAGSFGEGVASNLNFKDSRLKPYDSVEQYADALSKGSKHGGVSAIVDEIPYIKAFLAKYSADYSMIGVKSSTNGFAFVFRKGLPLTFDISRAIEKLREQGRLIEIENRWFKSPKTFMSQDPVSDPKVLNISSFSGLFLISGSSLVLAIVIYLFYEKWHVVRNCNLRSLIR